MALIFSIDFGHKLKMKSMFFSANRFSNGFLSISTCSYVIENR